MKSIFQKNTIAARRWISRLSSDRKKIFVFGPPHSGKSTLLSYILKYYSDKEGVTLRRDPQTNNDGVMVIRRLLAGAQSQKFPLQTPANEYTLVRFGFQYHGEENIHEFEMYEIAGEDVVKFDPANPDHDNIPVELERFLYDCHGILLVASSAPETSLEREQFTDFLEMIDRDEYHKNTCFMVTKYDIIANKYSDCVKAAKGIYPGATSLLFNIENSTIMKFSVGKVSDNKIMDCTANEDVEELAKWMESL